MTSIENLSALFVVMFNKDKRTLEFLIDSYVPKYVFLKEYESLVRFYGLVRIENLPESEKRNLVTECRATGLFFTNKSLTDAAKILHTIRFISET